MKPDHPQPPWYRQFWPWFLIALPATAVAASGVTIWLAVHSPNALVVDDYARIALVTEERFERDRVAADLGLRARLAFEPAARRVRVLLHTGTAQPESLVLNLVHPTLADQDRHVALAREGEGWIGETALPDGRWYVQLEPGDARWRLAGELNGERELALTPPGDR